MAERSPIFCFGHGRAFSLLLIAPLLAGCGGKAADPATDAPPGAVAIGEHLHAVPVGEPDEDGCQAFRLWSPDRMVDQAIRYRRADGSFSMNKLEAACMAGRSAERY